MARFRELLEEAVRIRLMADVPLGMFLSGGLDSSAIAALMARMIDRPLQTFSVAFKQRAFSELDYARQVATAIGADAHEDRHRRSGFLRRAAAPDLARGRADRASVEHAAVLRLGARARARQGRADRRRQRRVARRLRQVPAGAGQLARRRRPTAPSRRRCAHWIADTAGAAACRRRLGRYAQRSFLAMPRTPEAMFFDNFAGIGLRRQAALLSPAHRGATRPNGGLRTVARATSTRRTGRSTTLDRLLYTDLKTYLVELLMKQDQMSMAASIESRVPFLDHQLVEFAAALPARMKLRGFKTKWILREAVREILPGRDPHAQEDGIPGAVRRVDAGRMGRRRARRAARLAQPPARHHRPARGRTPASRRTRPARPTAATRSGAC